MHLEPLLPVGLEKKNNKYKVRNEKRGIIITLQLLFTFDSETDYDATDPMACLPQPVQVRNILLSVKQSLSEDTEVTPLFNKFTGKIILISAFQK